MSRMTRRTAWTEQLALYLPVVLMGVLALGTWWLLRSSQQADRTEVQNDNAAGPQYHIQSFTTQSFDAQGRLSVELTAHFARHDASSDSLVMQQVRLRSVDAQGQLMLAEADNARASKGLERFTLQGRARVWQGVAEQASLRPGNGRTAWLFLGEHLELDGQAKRVQSQGPARLERGQDRLSAQQMQYDDSGKHLSMQGQVRAVFHQTKGAQQR